MYRPGKGLHVRVINRGQGHGHFKYERVRSWPGYMGYMGCTTGMIHVMLTWPQGLLLALSVL